MSKRSAYLQIEGVPNPNAMKFVLMNGVLADKVYEFCSYQEAEFSPIARKLLMFPYVERVLINRNYITVLKRPDKNVNWDDILLELKVLIKEHLDSNEPILFVGVKEIEHNRSDDVVVEVARDLLEKFIRPAAQEDGGDILFDSFDNGVMKVQLHGACHGCPYSRQTITEGLEKVLVNHLPEVKKVVAVEWGE